MTSQLDGPSSPASPASSTSPASMTSTPDPDAYDIVATQGAYLFDPPRTPVWGFGHYNADFAAELEFGLKLAIRVQRWRRNQYHEAADEWLPGHTPPEVKEKRRVELERLQQEWDQTTDSSDGNDDNGASNKAADTSVAREKTMTTTSTTEPDVHDIVTTQGAYLLNRPRTPIWRPGNYNAEFAKSLDSKLDAAILGQQWRRNRYHEAADEWLHRFTPPEVREKRRAEVEWLCRDWDQTSDSSSNENDDNGASNKAVARKKTMAASDRLRKPLSQAESFPTPPPSTQIPPTTRTRKRRRISDNDVADGRERKRPITRRAGFTAQLPAEGNTAPKTSPQKSRKRQPAHDADDKDECDKKLPKKARLANDVDPTGSRGEWLRRLRPRRPVR